MRNNNDKEIIQSLDKQIAEIASLPVHQKRKNEWIAHNSLSPQRPMFMVDQICWNEVNFEDELTLKCQDEFSRNIENTLRRKLYKWKHIRDDNIVEACIEVPKIITGGRYNIKISETTVATDDTNSVVSHQFVDQLSTEEDIERLDVIDIVYDAAATKINVAKTKELVGDILDVKTTGVTMHLGVWDHISEYRGVQEILYDIIDRPDFIHKTMRKFTDLTIKNLDAFESMGLLEPAQSIIHCSGGWTSELPKPGFDPEKPRACDTWSFGMAQLFSTVSPSMHDEFEIQYMKPVYERFGLINYGCCEPLDRKIDMIRKVSNVRKISISPWADQKLAAMHMGSDYIFLRKPNPAFVAAKLDEQMVRRDLEETLSICKDNNAIPEFILKDISTVGYTPQNIWRWSEIAREVFGG